MTRIAFVPRVLALAAVALGASSCHRARSTAEDAGARAPDMPVPIRVDDLRKDLLFSYQDAEGLYHDTPHIADIPPAQRKRVLVRDLSRKPEEIHADEYLYVADLTQPEDGGYPYAVVSRYAFHFPEVALDADGGVSEGQVVVYGTSWCGACAQARQFLSTHGVPFVDKDIEKDPHAAAELARKARRAGLQVNGVPVLDVRGHLMEGFDPRAVERALRGG